MKQISYFLYFLFAAVALAAHTAVPAHEKIGKYHQYKNPNPMGISIVLYRVNKAEKLEELSNLERQMDISRSVNLYKVTEELGIIFMNTTNPYKDKAALPYQMLFGKYVEKQVGDRVINGFVSASYVDTICNWIKKHQVDKPEGFSKMYDGLSEEAKKELRDIGADEKEGLFTGYVQPLTQFYFDALKEKNSIVICGE